MSGVLASLLNIPSLNDPRSECQKTVMSFLTLVHSRASIATIFLLCASAAAAFSSDLVNLLCPDVGTGPVSVHPMLFLPSLSYFFLFTKFRITLMPEAVERKRLDDSRGLEASGTREDGRWAQAVLRGLGGIKLEVCKAVSSSTSSSRGLGARGD